MFLSAKNYPIRRVDIVEMPVELVTGGRWAKKAKNSQYLICVFAKIQYLAKHTICQTQNWLTFTFNYHSSNGWTSIYPCVNVFR